MICDISFMHFWMLSQLQQGQHFKWFWSTLLPPTLDDQRKQKDLTKPISTLSAN